MLDPKSIRSSPEIVRSALAKRGMSSDIVDQFLSIDQKKRALIVQSDELRHVRNRVSEEIGKMKKRGEDISSKSAEMRKVAERIDRLEDELRVLEANIHKILLEIPNLPHESVPEGFDEGCNQEVRRWGEIRRFDFPPRPHWEIGQMLDIIDMERAAKISGARFVLMRGAGALLERALINFMLDLHTREHGYLEIFPPYLVNSASLFGTGQLPKFEEDLFKCLDVGYYLIPTAEVPLTNIHRDEILDGSLLPLRYVGYSACFRSEAGSAGRDTRGLVRVHQFNKVELVKFTTPSDSYEELEKMTRDAEEVLRRLFIPYRVMNICAGDLGFSAAKKYDLEFWAPGQGRFIEVSSLSNCTDFQARRAQIRYRPHPRAKADLVHTLNGSGLAVGRTVIAVLENYQQEDGSVVIPRELRPYMGGLEKICMT